MSLRARFTAAAVAFIRSLQQHCPAISRRT
jgi:hypothetical protein